MSDPIPPRVVEIRARLDALYTEVNDLRTELDAYRVKCPTCRCEIIPGEGCSCCDDAALLPEEMTP